MKNTVYGQTWNVSYTTFTEKKSEHSFTAKRGTNWDKKSKRISIFVHLSPLSLSWLRLLWSPQSVHIYCTQSCPIVYFFPFALLSQLFASTECVHVFFYVFTITKNWPTTKKDDCRETMQLNTMYIYAKYHTVLGVTATWIDTCVGGIKNGSKYGMFPQKGMGENRWLHSTMVLQSLFPSSIMFPFDRFMEGEHNTCGKGTRKGRP